MKIIHTKRNEMKTAASQQLLIMWSETKYGSRELEKLRASESGGWISRRRL